MVSNFSSTGITLEHLRKSVKEKQHASVPFPLSYKELSEGAECFLEFLRLPRRVKQSFFFCIDSHDPENIVGYIRRQKKEGDYDEKEYFHHNRYAHESFRGIADSAGAEAKKFLESAQNIYDAAEHSIEAILREFDREFPGLYAQFFPEDRHPHFFLRFLKYNTAGKGNFLAGGHYDQGACTLALAESAPGLRIGLNETTLAPVEHRDGHAVFMPGLLLHTMTSKEFLPAWHDVVQKSEDTINEDTARWAIVFFADPVKKKKTNWSERHTPLV